MISSEDLVASLRAFIDAAVARAQSTVAVNPGHRLPFHWPPPSVSSSYHVLSSDWTGKATFEAYGEAFDVAVATTAHGVFGRCQTLWHEAKGETLDEMLQKLRDAAEPLLKRQIRINEILGRPGRFVGNLRDLPFEDLLKLLYCSDRDVANAARIEIDTHASAGVFAPALVEILRDNRHPCRRSAQWCVLDLFEDLGSFCHTEEERSQAIEAMRELIWNAEDDYCRTTFKAGVVLGGHLPAKIGGPLLIECLDAPSKIGRRSAIHGLFHVVEWDPDQRATVVQALRAHAPKENEPLLREFAEHMADDVEAGTDHITEPLFPGE